MPKPKLSLVGQKFGHLTVVAAEGSDGHHTLWKVRCDCGTLAVKVGTDIKKNARFCSHGCPLFRATMSLGRSIHSMSRHPAFAVWRSMLARCGNPNHRAFKNYGGRGIHVCPQWQTFVGFWNDMGVGYEPGLSIDRIDNDAGYSKENCRWTTPKTQCRNKRNNVVIPTPLGRMTVAEASDRFGIGRSTIFYRISRGWPGSQILKAPKFNNRILP
jgi:hypothetical protein